MLGTHVTEARLLVIFFELVSWYDDISVRKIFPEESGLAAAGRSYDQHSFSVSDAFSQADITEVNVSGALFIPQHLGGFLDEIDGMSVHVPLPLT